MLNDMDFAYVVRDKKLDNTPLSRGDIVLLISHKVVPSSSKDPYLLRKLFVVVGLGEDNLPLIPSNKNEHKAYLLDPRCLEKVDHDLQEQLKEKLKEY